MSDESKPVWVWLPGQAQPTECGVFTLRDGLGTFTYSESYLQDAASVALDPMHLPLGRRQRAMKETAQDGLFGVIRDAKPEGYGLDLLAHARHVRVDDPMHVLEMSEGDTIGAIEVCDDIAAKIAYAPPKSEDLLGILAELPESRASSEAVRRVKGIHGTSAGGERPKLTVLHEGQLWLAKLQDRGDQPHSPLREYVAMCVARECGVKTADVQFKLVGEREVILVRRFDRDVDERGATTRRLYASAHTVLHLDKQGRGARERSYISLSLELRRWCAHGKGKEYVEMQRELWRRIAMNAILGNGDDHPRNTGMVFDGEHWALSPAFDIAPYGHGFGGVQSMAISRVGSIPSSSAIYNLVASCKDYGYERGEALDYIERSRAAAPTVWRSVLEGQGFTLEDVPFQEPTWLDNLPDGARTPQEEARGKTR